MSRERRRSGRAGGVAASLLAALPEQDLHLEAGPTGWVAFCCNDRELRASGGSPAAALAALGARAGLRAAGRPAERRVLACIEACAVLFGRDVFRLEHVHGMWTVRWRRRAGYVGGEVAHAAMRAAARRWLRRALREPHGAAQRARRRRP